MPVPGVAPPLFPWPLPSTQIPVLLVSDLPTWRVGPGQELSHFLILPQIEGLMDDVDFKAKVTRAEFEELCADLFERVPGPVRQALQSAEMNLVRGVLRWARSGRQWGRR